jgi:1-acyl-sn-glycerol-3-phosphate acyltransferase
MPAHVVWAMRQLLARLVLAVSRYRITGRPPEDPTCVLVAAPHTTNLDFPLMLAIAWRSGLSPHWLGKKEMFRFPFGPLLRAVGGIEVDRDNARGIVGQLADRARAGNASVIVVPPEGTRSKGDYWKSGFYRIAVDAQIPIVLGYLDGPTKSGGFGPTFVPSGDIAADMDVIRAFYVDKRGVRPGKFTTPRLREEDHAA